jgi:hypothetical protein
MIASGRLRSNPNNNPLAHIGKGRSVAPMTKPTANRLVKAPAIAVFFSSSLMGIMVSTEMIPKTKPQITPSKILDMADVYLLYRNCNEHSRKLGRRTPNGLRYLRVGGRGQCLGAGKTRSQKNA